MTHSDSDEKLLTEWKILGDRRALEQLAIRYLPQFYRTARALALSHEQSEDIAQEVMLKVIRSLNSFRGENGFRVWSYTILLNTIRTEMQRSKLLHFTAGDLLHSVDAGIAEPAQDTIQQESRTAFEIALSRLTELQRTALVLMHIDGLSATEVGLLQDCSADAVYQRIAEAKRKLRNDPVLRNHWLEQN
jgi:RNA polymerase sigma-70 factor, ECF subfamily